MNLYISFTFAQPDQNRFENYSTPIPTGNFFQVRSEPARKKINLVARSFYVPHSFFFTQNTYGNPVGRVPIPRSYSASRILRVREPGFVEARIVSRVTGASGGTSGDCIVSQGIWIDICVFP